MVIRFLPINFEKDADLCVKFRIDSCVISFGNPESFYNKSGPDGIVYINWLKKIQTKLPNSALHVWEGNQIIGQLELTVREDEEEKKYGFIKLLYLILEKRGKGIGDDLSDFVDNFYRNLGISNLRLRVSLENIVAIKFYLKHGWKKMELFSDIPGTQYMEKNL